MAASLFSENAQDRAPSWGLGFIRHEYGFWASGQQYGRSSRTCWGRQPIGLCRRRRYTLRCCIEEVPSQVRRKLPHSPDKRYNLNLGPDAEQQSPVPVQSLSFWNLPNALTVARILLLPFIVLCFYIPQDWASLTCIVLFVLSSLTDWLDGYVARRLNITSAWGAFLDPVADKLSIAAVLVLLVERYACIWTTLPVLLILLREIAITALREWMATRGLRDVVAVSQHGKLKTVLQMTSVFLLLLGQTSVGLPRLVFYLGIGTLQIAAVLSITSGYAYFRAALEAHATYY
jgi:CDP-diacylglycerol--glycerol-3-phosphate 3-phosphatidyltransferase